MGFGTDMAKAKDIHKQNLRSQRKLRFQEVDAEWMQAVEEGADTTAIKAKKKALRDAPAATAISNATTEEELKASWDTTVLGRTPYTATNTLMPK